MKVEKGAPPPTLQPLQQRKDVPVPSPTAVALKMPDAPSTAKVDPPTTISPAHLATRVITELAPRLRDASPEKIRAELYAAAQRAEGPLKALLLQLRDGVVRPASKQAADALVLATLADRLHPGTESLRAIVRQFIAGAEEASKGTADFVTGVLDGLQPNTLAPSLGAPFHHQWNHALGAALGATIGLLLDATGITAGGGMIAGGGALVVTTAVAGAPVAVPAAAMGAALVGACAGAAAGHGKHLSDAISHLYEPIKGPAESTPEKTNPVRAPDAKATVSNLEKIAKRADDTTRRALTRQNELAEICAKHGFDVESLPKVGDKNPDLGINKRIFDAHAPSTDNPRNIASTLAKKIEAGQARRFIVDLRDTPVSVEALEKQVKSYPIEGLEELWAHKDGALYRLEIK